MSSICKSYAGSLNQDTSFTWHLLPLLRVKPQIPPIGVQGNPKGVKGLRSKLSPKDLHEIHTKKHAEGIIRTSPDPQLCNTVLRDTCKPGANISGIAWAPISRHLSIVDDPPLLKTEGP